MAIDDITQTPFTPLSVEQPVGESNVVSAASDVAEPTPTLFGSFYSPKSTPITLNNGALDDPINSMKSRLAKYDAANNNGTVKTLAILAAIFSKNFGPLLQLEEQKRKTRIANALMPEAVEINKLTSQGKWEDALNRATELGTIAGDRVPELAPFYQDITKRIVERQNRWEHLKSIYDIAKVRADEYKAKTGQDDPRLADVKILGLAVKNRDNVSEASLNQMMQQQQLKTQRIDNMMTAMSEGTGAFTSTTVPVAFKPTQFENYVGYTLGQAHGLNPTEITNVMNGQPVEGVDKDKAAKIREDYNAIQYVNANLDLANKVPMDPTQTLYLKRQGLSNEQIAQRLIGKDEATATINDLIGRQKELQEASVLAQINKNPYMPAAHGYMPVHAKKDDPNYLRPAPLMTHEQVSQSKGEYGLLPTKVSSDQLMPAMNALTGLSYIPVMFQERADPNAMFPTLSGGIAKLVADYTGIPINSTITLSEVARAVVRSSLEELESTQLLKRAEIGRLKNMVDSVWASEKDVLKATAIIKDRIYERVQNATGTQVEPPSDKNSPAKTPLVPVPTAPTPTTPGAATGAPVPTKPKLKMKW